MFENRTTLSVSVHKYDMHGGCASETIEIDITRSNSIWDRENRITNLFQQMIKKALGPNYVIRWRITLDRDDHAKRDNS